MDVPANLKYTKDHEWASIEGDVVTVGITDHAVTELGDIVFVELPKVGDQVEAEAVFGTIESVKAVAELFAPVSGEITEVNQGLLDAPESLNDDPYGEAWMVRITIGDREELDDLMDAEAYSEYVASLS